MRILTLTILTILFCLNYNFAWSSEDILDKNDALRMFGMSKEQWKENVSGLKSLRIGNFKVTSDKNITLYYRPTPQRGFLVITPMYKNDNSKKPWKILVTVIQDKKLDANLFNSMPINDVRSLLQKTSKQMQPEFSVMGYLTRGGSSPPTLNFNIFEKGKFPPIDLMISKGNVCPLKNGKQECILQKQIFSSNQDERNKVLIENCIRALKSKNIFKTKDELEQGCRCITREGQKGTDYQKTLEVCIK